MTSPPREISGNAVFIITSRPSTRLICCHASQDWNLGAEKRAHFMIACTRIGRHIHCAPVRETFRHSDRSTINTIGSLLYGSQLGSKDLAMSSFGRTGFLGFSSIV